MAQVSLSTDSIADYRRFLAIRQLPSYRISGHDATYPDEFHERITGTRAVIKSSKYTPIPKLFDYQSAISAVAIRKRKYCVFADCGLGKTLILMEFARHCADVLKRGQSVLIISPLMVIPQTIAESVRWYGDTLPIERIPSSSLAEWLQSGKGRIGITNYEALKEDVPRGRLGALILDESSMLKSHYGHYGRECLRLGAGLDYKLALTGTPAPNDRIEYANHAVFMDAFKTTNEFLARYFVNRGQTDNRWEIKPHALRPFYRDLSQWCIFLTNPATYGWKDNCEDIPPIRCHIEHVELTDDQPWGEEKFLETLRRRNAIGLVAFDGNLDVIGFAVYELLKDRIDILRLAVHPLYRREGVGLAMVTKLMSKVFHQRRDELWCDVPDDFPVASHQFLAACGMRTLLVRGTDGDRDLYRFVYCVCAPAEAWADSPC